MTAQPQLAVDEKEKETNYIKNQWCEQQTGKKVKK